MDKVGLDFDWGNYYITVTWLFYFIAMALGKLDRTPQREMFVVPPDLERHADPFYQAVNALLYREKFDDFVEEICAPYYAARMGRPSIPPGRYFRMLLLSFMEGIRSERALSLWCERVLPARLFLGSYDLNERMPTASTLSKTRERLSVEVHDQVFSWALKRLKAKGLIKGKTLGIDSTTLVANASMNSIVHRETDEAYDEWLNERVKEQGIEHPTREDRVKLDKRRPKKVSNDDWVHPGDPEAQITKLKDGRKRLAHKLEQAADLDTGAIVAVTIQTMEGGDPESMLDTLAHADWQLSHVELQPEEIVADKGYHCNKVMKQLHNYGAKSYVSERIQGKRNWDNDSEAEKPTMDNRERIQSERGKRLLRLRAEKVERNFAHLLDIGGMRRVYLRGQDKIRKRMLVQAAAFNLCLLMRTLHGVGKPRVLQGRPAARAALARQLARVTPAV